MWQRRAAAEAEVRRMEASRSPVDIDAVVRAEKCSSTVNRKQLDWEPVTSRSTKNRRGIRFRQRLVSDDVGATFKSTGSRYEFLSVFDGAKSIFRERSLWMAFTSPKCSPTTRVGEREPNDGGYRLFRRQRDRRRPGPMSSVSSRGQKTENWTRQFPLFPRQRRVHRRAVAM